MLLDLWDTNQEQHRNMNRILKRPMFRRGGSTNEGITSGLDAPRQGYKDKGRVLPFDMSKIVQDTVTQVQDPNIKAAYQPYFQRPEGEGLNRFLMDFGLNLMSTPPRGGFLSTAASAAKQPVSNLFDDLDAERMGKSAAEADLFKTLLQGNIDIAAEAAGNTTKAKSYAKLEIADNIENTMKDIVALEERQKNGEDVAQEIKEKKARLTFLTKEDAVGKSLMENKDFSKRVLFSIIAELKKETLEDGKTPKYKGDSDPALLKEAYKKYEEFFLGAADSLTEDQGLAEGGRAGYNQGGMTETTGMQDPGMEMQETKTMEQGSDDKIDYATLRARLPQQITDDIVRLIAASPEALEDFATIATQQDVDLFNQKYSVNLVLPQE